jgi:hypothetical protein
VRFHGAMSVRSLPWHSYLSSSPARFADIDEEDEEEDDNEPSARLSSTFMEEALFTLSADPFHMHVGAVCTRGCAVLLEAREFESKAMCASVACICSWCAVESVFVGGSGRNTWQCGRRWTKGATKMMPSLFNWIRHPFSTNFLWWIHGCSVLVYYRYRCYDCNDHCKWLAICWHYANLLHEKIVLNTRARDFQVDLWHVHVPFWLVKICFLCPLLF